MLKIEELTLEGCRKIQATDGEEKWFTVDLINRYWLKLRIISFNWCEYVDEDSLNEIASQRDWLTIIHPSHHKITPCMSLRDLVFNQSYLN